jgi:hypothetical protein
VGLFFAVALRHGMQRMEKTIERIVEREKKGKKVPVREVSSAASSSIPKAVFYF